MTQIFEKLTDPYQRKARLYPAILTALPILISTYLIWGDRLNPIFSFIPLILSGGGIFFLSLISRIMGKRLEKSLYKSWGGKPSTQLLRYSNSEIDRVTKERYHSILSKGIGRKFPSRAEEEKNPHLSDEIYEAGVNWLLEQTRDHSQYALLYDENISYGFFRNMHGMRPWGIFSALLSVLIILANTQLFILRYPYLNLHAFPNFEVTSYFSLLFSCVSFIFWISLFNRKSVRRAGFEYASRLLKSCDSISRRKS